MLNDKLDDLEKKVAKSDKQLAKKQLQIEDLKQDIVNEKESKKERVRSMQEQMDGL